MEDKIKCGKGIVAFIRDQPVNIIEFTGKPMTEREYKMTTRNWKNDSPELEGAIEFIRKTLYEKKL